MASRVSAIRGYRAVTGEPYAGPTPFRGGDVSAGAIFAKVGHGLIAQRRARSAMAQLDRDARLQEQYTQAQIADLESRTRERNAGSPTMSLTVPGHDQGTAIGPPAPEVIRGLTPNEYATQNRLYYPQADAPKPISAFQQESLELRRRGLGLARERLDRSAASSQEWRAAQAELSNINAEETLEKQKAENISLGEANIYGNRAAARDPQAIAALGGDPKLLDKYRNAEDLLQYVDALKKDYHARRVSSLVTHVKVKNQARRARAEAVTQQAAGLGGAPNAEQQFLETLQGVLNAPDEEAP
jgi:hypothetical protein